MIEGPIEYIPIERIIRDEYNERGVLIDNGKIVYLQEGTPEGVTYDDDYNGEGLLEIHNHPEGGPFSAVDMIHAYAAHLAEIRVSTETALYSLKPKNGKIFDAEPKTVMTAIFEEAMETFGDVPGVTEERVWAWMNIDNDIEQAHIYDDHATMNVEAERWVDAVASRLNLEFRIFRWSK